PPRWAGLAIRHRFVGLKHGRFQEWNSRFQYGLVAGAFKVVRHGVGEPQQIVGASCAHAAAVVLVPPMLDITFEELPRGGPQEMLPEEIGSREREGHH